MIYKNFRFRKDAVLITGRVVETNEIVSGLDQGGTTKFAPVFEFKSPAGEMLRGKTTSASIKYDFLHHSEHKILVNFHKPEIVQMPADRTYLKAIVIMTVSATILFGGCRFMLSLG